MSFRYYSIAQDIKRTFFGAFYKAVNAKNSLQKKTTAFYKTKKSKHSTLSACNIGMELKEVVTKLEIFASPRLAESWDNVGLLMQPSSPLFVKTLFLTNDLTEKVLTEAISKEANMILCYHPPIFRPLKKVTQNSWKERLVVKALEHRVAVYSPHTAYDSIKGGVNDWLISCFEGVISPINPSEDDNTCGTGRICRLNTPLSIADVIFKTKKHLGLNFIRIAYKQNDESEMVTSIASCAGSGSKILEGVRADVYLTGEMSHHEILDAVSDGVTVLLCEHSNTERGFLKMHAKTLAGMFDYRVQVIVSEEDRDPIKIV